MAEKDCAIKIDGGIVELPAYKNVVVKNFSSIEAYADENYYDPKYITKFDIFYNDVVEMNKISLYKWGSSKDNTTARNMGMSGLTSFNSSGMDTSKMTSSNSMFNGAQKLSEIDVSGWDISNITDMYGMFFDCYNITSINMSGWNTSKAVRIDIFSYDTYLTNIIFGPKWGSQTSTAEAALTLNMATVGSSQSYKLTDATYNSMLTMYDRKTAGLTNMTIQFSTKHNLPTGWADKMAARGYTITQV